MRRRLPAIFGSLIVVVAFQIVTPVGPASGVPTIGVTVIPPLHYLSVSPGDDSQNVIKIQNLDTRPRTFNAVAKSFVSDADGKGCVPVDTPQENSIASWLSVSPTQKLLQPNELAEFQYQLKVPANAEPGGHYGALVFQAVPDALSKDASGVQNVLEGSSCFLIDVSGDARIGGSLVSFTAKPGTRVIETAPVAQPGALTQATSKKIKSVEFTTRIKSTGNTHIRPTGQIYVSNIFGSKLTPIPIEPGTSEKAVLPNTTRKFVNHWDKPKVGFYRAKLKVFYDTHHPQLTSEVTFWILPPLWMWLILLAIVLALFALWRSRRRIKKAYRAFRDA